MKKILLIEDDPFILDVYCKCFLQEGYVVDFASNENKALEKIESIYPDLLILDLNLNTDHVGPQDGLNFLRKIRKNLRTRNLKVIVVSNYDEKNYPELSNLNELGVMKFFLKIQNSPTEIVKYAKEVIK